MLKKQPNIELLRIKGRVLGQTDHTEPDVVGDADGLVVAAVSRAAVAGVADPGAAAQQLLFVSSRTGNKPGLVIARGEVVTVMPVVLAPLPDIAVHVVQAPAIGRQAGHLAGLLAIGALGAVCIYKITVVVGQFRRQRGAKVKRRAAAGTAGVFPLGLAWQPVKLARALAQAAAELLRVVPAHPLHRKVRALELGRIGLQVALQLLPSRHHPPLGLGDRRLGHPEGAQLHLVLGAFIVESLRLALRRAHQKAARRDLQHGELHPLAQLLPVALHLQRPALHAPAIAFLAQQAGAGGKALQPRGIRRRRRIYGRWGNLTFGGKGHHIPPGGRRSGAAGFWWRG